MMSFHYCLDKSLKEDVLEEDVFHITCENQKDKQGIKIFQKK